MDSGSPAKGNLELIEEFRRCCPLIDSVTGRFGENLPNESIPWFFGFILSAAAKPGAGACCIVLDKSSGTTAIAAILAGLLRLQNDFPHLMQQYALTALKRGQRVKVRPNNYVYEYDGVFEDYSNHFRLKFLGKESWRSLPIDDVLRLEPTDRVRPKGDGGSDLGDLERSPLDRLLDITTGGNNSLIKNTVLLQIPRAHLTRITDATTFLPAHSEEFACLSCYLPWGYIDHDGTLIPNDSYQVVGEPLIAATSVPEDLALACICADKGTKTVFVDGARRLARDLQAFDDIADHQRLVILASPDETEDLDLLGDRDCAVWHMPEEAILIGETPDQLRTRKSPVGSTIRAAEVRRHCSVIMADCHDTVLQAAAESLERVVEMTANHEEKFEIEEALARLFRILFELSECCLGIGEITADELHFAQAQIVQHAKWMEQSVQIELRDAIDALKEAIRNGSGKQKADAILSILTEDDRKWAIATRSPRSAEWLRDALNALGADSQILPISTISSENEFDGIIVPAWPNGQRFSRLRNLSIAPDIRILTYPFEHKWVLHHLARERTRTRSNRLETCQLSRILGIKPHFLTSLLQNA